MTAKDYIVYTPAGSYRTDLHGAIEAKKLYGYFYKHISKTQNHENI